jgi:hypothetical protein
MTVLLLTACGTSSSPSQSPTPPSAPTAPSGTWTALHPLGQGIYTQLEYAQCNGANDCWADGFREDSTTSYVQFLEHWNGQGWSISSPTVTNANGPGYAHPTPLGELDCLPSGLCVIPNTATQATIDSVTSGGWTQMPSDNPGTAALPNSSANSVACISETLCLAVGNIVDATFTHAMAIGLVWDGTSWTSTVLPLVGADPVNNLISVSCASQTLCFGVGFTSLGPTHASHHAMIAKWDGSTWSATTAPSGTRFDSIVCVDPTFCLAAGSQGSSSLILRWDGSTWTPEQMPPTGSLYTINCSSRDLCMALQTPDPNKPLGTVPVALRWHGTWFKVTGYPAVAANLSGVACVDTGCMVVGWDRSTPSSGPNDISDSRSTAAMYTINGASSSSSSTPSSGASSPAASPIPS